MSPKYLYFLMPEQEKQVRDPDGTRRKEILVTDIEQFRTLWKQAVGVGASDQMLRHPQEFGVVSSTYLPYVSICRSCRDTGTCEDTPDRFAVGCAAQDKALVLGLSL
ncbi:MAG: hypothetical protein R3D67_18780 [Hyphomicrobiaceae bacterium]